MTESTVTASAERGYLHPENGQGMGWSDTCLLWGCGQARLEVRPSPYFPAGLWTCPSCRASYGDAASVGPRRAEAVPDA